jgi:hypothetical protein
MVSGVSRVTHRWYWRIYWGLRLLRYIYIFFSYVDFFVQFTVTFRMRLLLRLRLRVPYATSMTLQILFQPGTTLFVRGIIVITPRVRGESAAIDIRA